MIKLIATPIDKSQLDKPTPSVEDLAKKYKTDSQQIEEEIAKGVEIELEHTSDKAVAREIALDHLNEDLDYYVKLEKVEALTKEQFNKWKSERRTAYLKVHPTSTFTTNPGKPWPRKK